jgi:hypothetical protein
MKCWTVGVHCGEAAAQWFGNRAARYNRLAGSMVTQLFRALTRMKAIDIPSIADLPVLVNSLAVEGVARVSLPEQRASLPAPNPTVPFWAASPDDNPLAKEGSQGDLTTDADLCIIGSGITGVGAAYHLSKLAQSSANRKPFKAVILEARDFCECYNRARSRSVLCSCMVFGRLRCYWFVGFFLLPALKMRIRHRTERWPSYSCSLQQV